MSVFEHSYSGPFLGQSQLIIPGSGVTRRFTLEDGKLDARGCLTSRSMPFTSKWDVSLLLPKAMKLNLAENSIHTIDLSMNNLFSNDLQYVVGLLKRLQPHMTNSAILSLEGHKIHGIGEYHDVVDAVIGENAVMDKISFIEMRTNPFCTVDRKDFFMGLEPNDLVAQKLVWIQSYNLSGYGWKGLVKYAHRVL